MKRNRNYRRSGELGGVRSCKKKQEGAWAKIVRIEVDEGRKAGEENQGLWILC